MIAAEGYCRQALEALGTTLETPGRDQQELTLQLALGQVFIATRGYVAPETTAAYDRASILGERLGNPMKVVASLSGLFSLPFLQGELGAAQAMAERVRASSDRDGKPRTQVWSYYLNGVVRYHRGDLAGAWECLCKARALYQEEDHRRNPQDPGCETLEYMALTAWQLGMVEIARTRIQDAIELSKRLRKPYALAHCQFYAAFLHAMLRDAQTTQVFAESAVTISTEQSIPLFYDAGRILHGWAIALQGNSAEGMRHASEGLANFRSAGNRLGLGLFAGRLAEAQASAGDLDAALTTVQDALSAAPNELVNMPYILWLHGELHLGCARNTTTRKVGQSMGSEPAEESFREAISLADRIGAKSYGLRAATSLGQLLKTSGRSAAALEIILPRYKGFADSCETRDLIDARTLLGELS